LIRSPTAILNQGSCKNESIKKGRDLQTTTYNSRKLQEWIKQERKGSPTAIYNQESYWSRDIRKGSQMTVCKLLRLNQWISLNLYSWKIRISCLFFQGSNLLGCHLFIGQDSSLDSIKRIHTASGKIVQRVWIISLLPTLLLINIVFLLCEQKKEKRENIIGKALYQNKRAKRKLSDVLETTLKPCIHIKKFQKPEENTLVTQGDWT